MARREKKKQEVSLFPFLDILACVIGNLILIITAVVLEQVDTKPIAEQAKREAVQQQTKQDLLVIEELKKTLEDLKRQSIAGDKRIERAQQQIAAAEKQQQEAREKLRQIPPPPPPPDEEDLAKVKEREEGIQKIIAEIQRLQGELEKRKEKPDQSISILYENKGRGGVRRPFFVEISKSAVTLLPNDLDYKNLFGDEKPRQLPLANIGKNQDFKKLLDYVLSHKAPNGLLRGRRDTIVTFLVRPDAINAYRDVAREADQFEKANEKKLVVGMLPNGAPVLDSLTGKAPLPGEGKIVLD